jgi:hypothetical protein
MHFKEDPVSDIFSIDGAEPAQVSSAAFVDTVRGRGASSKRPTLDLVSARHADITRELAGDPATRAEYFLVAERHGSASTADDRHASESDPSAVDEERSKGPTILCNIITALTVGVCSQTSVLVVSAAGPEQGPEQDGEPTPAPPTDGVL